MNKIFKKLTALCLTLVMVFSCNTFTFVVDGAEPVTYVSLKPLDIVKPTSSYEEHDGSYITVDENAGEYQRKVGYVADVIYTDAACENEVEVGDEVFSNTPYYAKLLIEKGTLNLPFAAAEDIYININSIEVGEDNAPTLESKRINEDGELEVVVKYIPKNDSNMDFYLFIPGFEATDTPNDFTLASDGNYNTDFKAKVEIFSVNNASISGEVLPFNVGVDSITWYDDDEYSTEHDPSTVLDANSYYAEAVIDYSVNDLTGDDADFYAGLLTGNYAFEYCFCVFNNPSLNGYQKYLTNDISLDKANKKATIRFEIVKNVAPKVNNVELLSFSPESITIGVTGNNFSDDMYVDVYDSQVEDYETFAFRETRRKMPKGSGHWIEERCTSSYYEVEIEACDMQDFSFAEGQKVALRISTGVYGSDLDLDQLYNFTISTEPNQQPAHTTKKYTAKNVNTSAEKISGAGKKGSTRTITPKEGKKVASVVVTDKQGNKIDVTMNEDGTYSFIQPASIVNVEVNYKNREIKLTIGSTNAYVDEELNSLDVCPVIRNDRTMLPIRFVAENLGAKVGWDEKNPNIVTIKKDDIEIVIHLGSDKAFVNGKEYKLDSVAFAENDRTYLPVRFVSENLNAIVEWNEAKPMDVKIYER